MDDGSAPSESVRTNTGTFRSFNAEQRVFNRYLIRQELGRGGRGVVYLAQDLRLFCVVALKFMADELVREPEALEELRHETLVSRKITHPYIMRIYDFEQDSTAAAISMEYVEGETLSQLRFKRERHCFDPEEITRWMIQLSEALHYAHSVAGIVHRDLKPSNLMVGADGRLKITDFGIASVIADSMSRVTRTQLVSGTLPYMSPQQALGDLPRESDDIYSFGAVMYELLTSKPPFFRGNVAAQIHTASVPLMAQRRAELGRDGPPIPKFWEDMVAKCLAKNPEDRPSSAGVIAEWLEKGLKDNIVGSVAREKKESSTRLSDTRRKAHLAISAGVLFLVGILFWILNQSAGHRGKQVSIVPPMVVVTPTPPPTSPIPPAAKTAPIIVNTMPSGADVYLNGEGKGKSPLQLEDVGIGNWRLRVERAGYENEEVIVEVREDGTTQPPLIELVKIPSTPVPQKAISTPSPSSPAPVPLVAVATKDAVTAVISSYTQAMIASDANGYASLCAARVSYFDEGARSKDYVRKSREFFGRMFSNYEIHNLRNIIVREGPEPATAHASFTYDYSTKSLTAHTVNHKVVGPGLKKGTVTDTLDLQKLDGQWLITKMSQDKL